MIGTTAKTPAASPGRWPAALLAMILAAFCTLSAAPARADWSLRLNAPHGVAVDGYDPVAYFTEGRAVPGRAEFALRWRGVRWHFSSAAHRAAFEADPRAYAPQFGGFCAVAMGEGRVVPASPENWVIIDQRLYLTENAHERERLAADAVALVTRARNGWAAPAVSADR